MSNYVERLNDRLIAELMAELPAVLIVGPRGSGKTTSGRRLARTVIRLDRSTEARPVRDDPDVVLGGYDEPILLDEWQAIPEVLGSVKRLVDDRSTPGRFLLTGSVRAELLASSWAATGRVVRVGQWGISERELAGNVNRRSIVDAWFADDFNPPPNPIDPPNLRDYVDLALRGSFPELVSPMSASARGRWLHSYVDQLVMRDATLHDEQRDPVRLRRYLAAVAANTAGLPAHKTLYDAAGVSRVTAVSYDALLELMFVIELVPAWHSNRLQRVAERPKRYLVDAALLGPLAGVDSRAALRDGDLLGRVVDTFVVGQLRPELEVAELRARMFHLRSDDGSHEVDLIVEAPDGRIVAIEIKSSAAPDENDAKHLTWLRDRLGDRFVRGVVFHTGPRPYRLGERVDALPICSIWK